MIGIIPTQMSVQELVKEFSNGTIGIPEIQRDVVWDSSQIKSLLDSILRGYPCGSIILWEPREKDKHLIKSWIRPERLKSHDKKLPRYFLLDGQQRISSLASFFLDRSNLRSLLYELEEDMPFLFVNLKNIKDIDATTEKSSYKFPWVPIADIVMNSITSIKDYSKLDQSQKYKIEEFSNRLKTYNFPTQIISNVNYEEIGEIFSRINSQGTQLTGAEIYLAKIVPRWKGITKEFRKFREEMHDKYQFDIDITFLMKIITSIACNVPQIKKLSDKVTSKDLNQNQLNRIWSIAKQSFESVIKVLRKEVYLDRSKHIISRNALVPLVYYYSLAKKKNAKVHNNYILKYFLLSQLSEHYGGASESKLKNDIRTIWEENNLNIGMKELVKTIEVETRRYYHGLKIKPENIEGIPSKNIFLLLMYIVMKKRLAKDLGISGNKYLHEILSKELTLHHIFPVNFMMRPNLSSIIQNKHNLNPAEYRGFINDIANLTFSSQGENSAIGDTPPSQYLKNVMTKETRKAHFIPENSELWTPSNFIEFIEERRKLLSVEITRLIKKFN